MIRSPGHGSGDRGPIQRSDQVNVPEERYQQIADVIANEQSPVGIDAKRTHVMILYMLEEIDKRVARIEEYLSAG